MTAELTTDLMTVDEARVITREALVRSAVVKLARIDNIRAAVRLARAGKSQRDIAEMLHVTQPVVHRMLRDAEFLGTAIDPEEIILRATVDGTSRDDLVASLSSWKYTFAGYAPYPAEGGTPGSWTQVEHGYYRGMLSRAEYERICAAVQPPATE